MHFECAYQLFEHYVFWLSWKSPLRTWGIWKFNLKLKKFSCTKEKKKKKNTHTHTQCTII